MPVAFMPIAKNNVRSAVALLELLGAGLRAGTFCLFGPAGTPRPTGFLRARAAKKVNNFGNCYKAANPNGV